jgi:hypothetical protein
VSVPSDATVYGAAGDDEDTRPEPSV